MQIDEPVLALDLSEAQASPAHCLPATSPAAPKIMLANYFGGYGDNRRRGGSSGCRLSRRPCARAHGARPRSADDPGRPRSFSGVIDGRNIWRANLDDAFALTEKVLAVRSADVLQIAPSCSLIHTPVDLESEGKLDAELKDWMAFSKQKLAEVVTLAMAATEGGKAAEAAFLASREAVKRRQTSARIHNPEIAERIATISARILRGKARSRHGGRNSGLRSRCPLSRPPPSAPFPQTAEVEKRALHIAAGSSTMRL